MQYISDEAYNLFFAMVCRQTKDSRSCGKLLSVVKKKKKMTVQQSITVSTGDKKTHQHNVY